VGLPARDAAGWTDAILGLLGDPDARAAMGRRGRELVEREYSLAALAPRLAALLRETAGRSG
jgi:glycosyltransferase involved in cell wall biosynthesis